MKDYRITEASYTWRQMIRNDKMLYFGKGV